MGNGIFGGLEGGGKADIAPLKEFVFGLECADPLRDLSLTVTRVADDVELS